VLGQATTLVVGRSSCHNGGEASNAFGSFLTRIEAVENAGAGSIQVPLVEGNARGIVLMDRRGRES
jgi:hypothetical protein